MNETANAMSLWPIVARRYQMAFEQELRAMLVFCPAPTWAAWPRWMQETWEACS